MCALSRSSESEPSGESSATACSPSPRCHRTTWPRGTATPRRPRMRSARTYSVSATMSQTTIAMDPVWLTIGDCTTSATITTTTATAMT